MNPFFVRASKYEELLYEADRLRVKVNQLTAEVSSLKKLNAELMNNNEKCRKKVLQSQDRLDEVLGERYRLRNSIEVLEKEREVFQKTIERLISIVKKKSKKERKA